MKITIYANNSENILVGNQEGFIRLREKIASIYDEEFGKHYRKLKRIYYDIEGQTVAYLKWFKTAERIIKRNKLENKDILDFLFKPNKKGKLKVNQIKNLYELIKDINSEVIFRFYYSSENDFKDFKELLKECIERRDYLRWG